MPAVVLLENNTFTREGQELVAYLTETIREALKDPTGSAFNKLSGEVQDFYVKTLRIPIMTPEKWFADYPNAAQAAYGNFQTIKALRESPEVANSIADGQNKIVEQLQAFQAAIQDQIDGLKADMEVLKQPKATKKTEKAEAEDKPQTEA